MSIQRLGSFNYDLCLPSKNDKRRKEMKVSQRRVFSSRNLHSEEKSIKRGMAHKNNSIIMGETTQWSQRIGDRTLA